MNNYILFYDTETTGFVKKSTSVIGQPHIVQLAALLVCEHTRKIVNSLNVIVKPYGWDIPEAVVNVHGITKDYALAVGAPEGEVISIFLSIWNHNKRVAYNVVFDDKIIDFGLQRYNSYSAAEEWRKGNTECCMKLAKEVMCLPKYPKLSAAYEYFIGGEMPNKHDAMGDTVALMDVYFKIKDSKTVCELG